MLLPLLRPLGGRLPLLLLLHPTLPPPLLLLLLLLLPPSLLQALEMVEGDVLLRFDQACRLLLASCTECWKLPNCCDPDRDIRPTARQSSSAEAATSAAARAAATAGAAAAMAARQQQ